VVDEQRQEMLVHRRFGGRWRTRAARRQDLYTTRVLPGFQFDLGAAFTAARAVSG
jgi:hypothetical protein